MWLMKNSWNALSRGKKIVVGVVGFFLVMSLIGVLFGSDTATVSDSDEVPSATSESKEPESPLEKLTKAVREEAGDKTNLDGYSDRIKEISVTNEIVAIDLMGSDNLTEGLVKGANRGLVLDAIKAYQKASVSSEKLAITIWFPLVDNLGNAELDEVLIYEFSSSQIEKINPEGVDTKRMDENFADVYTYVHPAFEW
jgi:hypothetical protein